MPICRIVDSCRVLLFVPILFASFLTLSGCGEGAAPTTAPGAAPVDKDLGQHQKEMEDFMAKQSKK